MNNRLKINIAQFTITRVIVNTVFRIVYPLSSVFIAALGISFAQFSALLGWRSIAGGLGPFFAAVGDTRGRKFGLIFGTILVVAGMAVIVFWPVYIGFFIGMVLLVWGKYTFDPSMHAYLSDRIPYESRGRVLGLVEYGWSGATLIGIPLAAFIIEKNDWITPFPIFLGMTIFLLISMYIALPNDPQPTDRQSQVFANLGVVFSSRAALAGLSITLLISVANEVINLVFGVWLKETFALTIAALGLATLIFGAAELLADSGVILFTDRLGKRRAIGLGVITNSIAAICLPFIGGTQTGAFIGLFFFYLTFEFTYVSTIPLMTEILPETRATLMAVNIASASAGRAIAAVLAPWLFGSSFAITAFAAAAINLLAIISLRWALTPEERIIKLTN